jgi:hypothetical protein
MVMATSISDCDGLQAIATDCATDCSGTYELTGSFDCSGIANFQPIGTESYPFTGTFEGQNHTITGLYINRTTNFVGLFGNTGSAAVIRNVGLINVNITGNNRVGGLVGQSNGRVTNSYSTGTVSGNGYIGGLIGENYENGLIDNSYSIAAVTAGALAVGGLAGYNFGGNVNNSYSTGTVNGASSTYLGGLIGQNANNGRVSNSYATGIVLGGQYKGGLIGVNFATVSNSYWDKCRTGKSVCCGYGTGGCTDSCFGKNIDGSETTYFYNQQNEPMLSWIYPPWNALCDDTGYPTLAGLSGQSCTGRADTCLGGASCGNGVCEIPEENVDNCPQDCEVGEEEGETIPEVNNSSAITIAALLIVALLIGALVLRKK